MLASMKNNAHGANRNIARRLLQNRSNSANLACKNQGKSFTIFCENTRMKLDNIATVFYLPPAFQRALATRAWAINCRSLLSSRYALLLGKDNFMDEE